MGLSLMLSQEFIRITVQDPSSGDMIPMPSAAAIPINSHVPSNFTFVLTTASVFCQRDNKNEGVG
jgi:hypothetical protein